MIHDSYEIDVLEGLEQIALQELMQLFGRERLSARIVRPATLWLPGHAAMPPVLRLRSAIAAYALLHFDLPRPKALLGHQYFTALTQLATQIMQLHQQGTFRTLRLSAAGEDSSVLQRLHTELAAALGLTAVSDEGDLLLRLRRGVDQQGWDVLMRLSPRPLATRLWRVCNFPGAVNASLANAIARMSEPQRNDRVLNLCCGSGTLLIERMLLTGTREALGCDHDQEALDCAKANLAAAGLAGRARLERWDATALPLDTASVDVILADLPFGQLIGTHRDNERLYPRILSEAARVAAPGARMLLLSHEVRLLDAAIDDLRDYWQLQHVLGVRTGGMMPRIFLLRRNE